MNGADPTVKTTSGTVHGHSAPGVSNVSEYLGIPYVCIISREDFLT